MNRKILYERLRRREILDSEQMQLLEFIHSNMRIDIGDKSITTSRGVPQGLTTSPILFNIFVEPILEELEQADIFGAMYADDLLITTEDENQARRAIRIV